MQALSFGLIGCGNIARSAHLPAIVPDLRTASRLGCYGGRQLDAAAQVAAEPWGCTALPRLPSAVAEERCRSRIGRDTRIPARRADCRRGRGRQARLVREANVPVAGRGRSDAGRVPSQRGSAADRPQSPLHAALHGGPPGAGARGRHRRMVRLLRENERRTSTHMVRMGQAGTRWTPQHWTGDPKLGGGVILSHPASTKSTCCDGLSGAEPVSVMAETGVTTPGNTGMPDFVEALLSALPTGP